jgi:hypothetical protein
MPLECADDDSVSDDPRGSLNGPRDRDSKDAAFTQGRSDQRRHRVSSERVHPHVLALRHQIRRPTGVQL